MTVEVGRDKGRFSKACEKNVVFFLDYLEILENKKRWEDICMWKHEDISTSWV